MKNKLLFSVLFACILLLSGAAAFGAEPSDQGAPMAVAPHPEHAFKTVLEGSEVLHNFIIQNQGSAVLDIKKVKTS